MIMPSRYSTRVISVLCALLIFPPTTLAQQKRLLGIEDLLAVKTIVELELSPSGNEVVYLLQEANLKDNRNVRTMWRMPTTGRMEPVRATDSDKDFSPRWSPDGKSLAFLSTRSGLAQIWLLDISSNKLEKITDSKTSILSFKWSPDGQRIAYLSQDEGKGSFDDSIKKDRGVVIDKEIFVVYRLLRNQLFLDLEKISHLSLLDLSSRQTERVRDVQHVEEFVWSPDGRALALTSKPAAGDKWSSNVVIYDPATKQSVVALKGNQAENWDHMTSYSGPLWSPDGQQLAFLYKDRRERWSSVHRVGIYTLKTGKLTLITKESELELYFSKFFWSSRDEIYLENSVNGSRGLFALSTVDGKVRAVLSSVSCDDQFSFSVDYQKLAFVHQNSQQPPEIFVSEFPFKRQTKLTSLNHHFDGIQLPSTERVSWLAPDGLRIEGTLFKPINYAPGKTYPLLVFVHGGPTIAIENRFEPYSVGPDWLWPYPFRLFADRGYAVFLPDYRGTASYGKTFRQTRDILKDPSDDIVSGISFLIKRGMVDQDKIGIMGQSHGGWLGPYVMAHKRIFKAASFAEGFANMMAAYAQTSGRLNLNVHEYYLDGSPYDNPQRYIELSPIFNFQDLTTATLLEFGEQSLAVQGLDFQSALWRRGVPHEMVIYPKTGHNISSPTLMLESINRNLDWFDYWMLGKRNPDPSKQGQHARWEEMKTKMDKMRSRKSSKQPVVTSGRNVAPR